MLLASLSSFANLPRQMCGVVHIWNYYEVSEKSFFVAINYYNFRYAPGLAVQEETSKFLYKLEQLTYYSPDYFRHPLKLLLNSSILTQSAITFDLNWNEYVPFFASSLCLLMSFMLSSNAFLLRLSAHHW